jgi:RHS repeat-associated protein
LELAAAAPSGPVDEAVDRERVSLDAVKYSLPARCNPRARIEVDPFPEVFAYDELNRLRERRQRQASGTDRVETFAYDALGNLTQMPGLGTYTFEPTRPQLIATAGGHEYHHDVNGNLTERSGPTVPGGGQSLQYTTFDLPSQITPAAGSSVPDVELEYDASQSRVLKRATDVCSGGPCPSVTTYYAGSLYTRTVHNEGAETETDHRYRVYAGGGAIAEIVRDTQGGLVTTVYPHTDALGSPNVFVNEDGDLTRQGFAPFGQPVSAMPSGDSDSLIGFTGHDHDAELGLINMQGRIYDPTVGRFLTADPIVQSPFWSQGLNRYAYVFNSPMNLVDPSGFSAIGDYFQGLNDAPPEQAIPGYVGTGLVAGLAAAAIYEGVSASFSAGSASAISAGSTQAGGGGALIGRGAGAATVAIQRIKAATEDSVTREAGEVPTRSATRPVGPGRAHATGQAELRIPKRPSLCDSGGCLADNGAGGASSADGGSEGNNGTGHYAPIIDDGGATLEILSTVLVPEARVVQVVVRATKVVKAVKAIRLGKKWAPKALKSCRTGCESAAKQIKKHIGGDIKRIVPMDPRASNLGAYRGQNIGWSHHEVVVKDGRVYDAFTGHKGATIDEYKALWEYADAINFGF